MENKTWEDYFIAALSEIHPKSTKLVQELMDLLNIGREAVYRRLRKDVTFPMYEILKIASSWHISLDAIAGINSGKIPFFMHPMSYVTPSKEDMDFVRKRVKALEQLKHVPYSEYMVVSNNASRSITAGFDVIYKFNIFKWTYEYCSHCNEDSNMPYSQVIIPEELRKEISVYYQRMKYVTETSYVWDNMMIEHLINEVRFFHSILLVTDNEKKLIKKELHDLLDYLIEVVNTGCFPETKNKVRIYASILNINTNYSYFYNGKTEECRIHAFNMYDNITYNKEMIENFKEWIQKKKRTSVLISEVDERSRIEFFTKQRKLIESL